MKWKLGRDGSCGYLGRGIGIVLQRPLGFRDLRFMGLGFRVRGYLSSPITRAKQVQTLL